MAAADDEEGQSENKKDEVATNARVNQFFTMQQEFENKLTKQDCTYENQVGLILSGWELLTCTTSDSHLSFAHFLYKWTLKLILQGEWPKLEKIVRTRLAATLQRCARNCSLKQMIAKIIPLVSDPWGNVTLKSIISSTPVPQTDVIAFVCGESWEIIRARVETLVESKCEPIAGALLQACLGCLPLKNESDQEVPPLSEEDHNYFVDLHLVLMYKSSKKQFLEKVKEMNPEEGVAFIIRLLSKDEKIKLWKHKLKISNLAIQIFLASCIVKTCDETYRVVFKQWCTVMKANNEVPEVLVEMVRKYIQLAESAKHIYVMGSVLHEMWNKQHAALVTELLIRALTLDMNSVERAKSKSNDNKDVNEHVKYERQMALGFMDLASLFADHETVARECVLTAFSLHPTEERLSRLKDFAFNLDKPEFKVKEENLSEGMESNTDEVKREKESIPNAEDPFVTVTEDLIKQLHVHTSHADILTAPQEVLDAKSLGLSKELCDDLAVVVSSPRWQVLSWMLKPTELLGICEKYLHNTDSAKNITKELKYLNIDYNQFRHLPSADVDEFTGIEKGYEHFMDDSEDDNDDDPESITIYSSTSETEASYEPKNKLKKAKISRKSRKGSESSESNCGESDYLEQSEISCAKGFEGKRVTSVSCLEPSKRLRIDPAGHFSSCQDSNKLQQLRLYRHQKTPPATSIPSGTFKDALTIHQKPVSIGAPLPASSSSNTTHSISSSPLQNSDIWRSAFKHRRFQYKKIKQLTNNCVPKPGCSSSQNSLPHPYSLKNLPSLPEVVISTKMNSSKESSDSFLEGSLLKAHLQGLVGSQKNNSTSNPGQNMSPSSSKKSVIQIPSNAAWKYSGYVVAGKPETVTTNSPARNPVPSTHKTTGSKLIDVQSSGFKQTLWGNMLSERNSQTTSGPKSKVSMAPNTGCSAKEDILKRGSQTYFSRTNRELALAQKNVLNRIMSPEHRKRLPLPQMIETIAMPVSHTPPNLPPSDKTNPAGLSRVLPKGTIVVRKPMSDSDAGPSGVAVISHSSQSGMRTTVSITPRRSTNTLDSPFQDSDSYRRNIGRFHTSHDSPLSNNNLQDSQSPNSPPLASATVAESISSNSSQRFVSPDEILSGTSDLHFTSNRSSGNVVGLGAPMASRTTTAVADIGGEHRGTSMLESLLRDRGASSTSIMSTSATTVTTAALHDPLVASSSANAGISDSPNPVSGQPMAVTTVSGSLLNRIACDSRSVTVGTESLENINVTGTEVGGLSGIFSSTPATVTNTQTRSIGTGSHSNILASSVNASTPNSLHQLVLPAQLIQVQGTDGSTGLGIVHSGSLDLRLPPGTRVIKSSNAPTAQSNNIASSQPQPRQLNVLHNLKIVHQNRPVVRTVLVPPSSSIQNLNQPNSTQLVSINPSTTPHVEVDNSVSPNKLQQTQLQKLLGHNVVPGGLVIRAVRPGASGESSQMNTPIRQHVRAPTDLKPVDVKREENQEELKSRSVPYSSHCEGLGERLTRHFLKGTLVATTSTQSVGTQTQTTAVKPVTGQIVSQVLMNPMKATNSTSAMTNLPVVSHVGAGSSNDIPPPLNLTAANSVSSETLEQLREFESVFEKVSNKSGKENEVDICPQDFPNTSISSEESMIAAQLLSMANDTPLPSSSTYICSMPVKTPDVVTSTTCSPIVATINTSVTNVVPSHLPEGTLINTQTGTLILVNPSNVASATSVQPPQADSPGLSSTSSHSSVASSPSSISGKSKKHPVKSKAASAPTPAVTTPPKPKSPPPPPPKVPPKPAVAKPQVEESDEIKARIQSILDQYKQDLANTPQPQPAPRNRKNCPPPKTEGKSSGKKKSQVKKSEGTSTSSPASIEGGHLPSVSSSPAALSTSTHGDDSDGGGAGSSASNRFSTNVEEKAGQEDSSPSIVQGVVVPNMKVEGAATTVGTLTSLPQALAGSRVFQLIRHGGKVAAIPANQSYHKLKSGLTSGSGPPNVTIQGRISVSDLMEGHLTSIISGTTGAAVTPNSSLIAKLLQPQQTGAIQQIVIQPSRQQTDQVIQQVTIPHIVQSPKVDLQEGESSPAQSSSLKSQVPPKSGSVATSPQSINSGSSPFPQVDEDTSNSSEPSQDDGRLPPFFTLTKPFMVPPNVKLRDKSQSDSTKAPTGSSDQRTENKDSGASTFVVTDMQCSKNDSDSSHILEVSQAQQISSETSFIATGSASEIKTGPIDTGRNDISSEEVQIPPSPATLTKQLQNAYMAEAALSPAISQSQLSSSSSYSPPATVQDLQFLEGNSESQQYSPALNQHRFSTAGTSGESSHINSSTSNGISNVALACLSSPSGDVYLDQAGVGLGLDSLPLEDNVQSPSLSDLVPAVPLLSWSPRSADSLMEQSPSFNHTIAGDINLDAHHSEDSLCDSSTTFPVLFSIEPDAASISSNVSEEPNVRNSNPSGSNIFVSSSLNTSTSPVVLRNTYVSSMHGAQGNTTQVREQDQTVSSTRIENQVNRSPSMPLIGEANLDSRDEDTTDSDSLSWRYGNEPTFLDKNPPVHTYNRRDTSIQKQNKRSFSKTTENSERRRSQRQSVSVEKSEDKASHVTNGLEKDKIKTEDLKEPVTLRTTRSRRIFSHGQSVSPDLKLERKEDVTEQLEQSKQVRSHSKTDGEENTQRLTRGSKRKSESVLGEEKKGRSVFSKLEHVKMEDSEKLLEDAEVAHFSKSLRGRHISGTSDTSSNFSTDRVSTPGPQDSPSANGRKRKRRTSHDSSVSSRDCSPILSMHLGQDGGPSNSTIVNTRRSSSREQSKKTRCACCSDHPQANTAHTPPGRRSSSRGTRGTPPK